MARPAVTAWTERVYARLPESSRAADEGLDWPLLRYLAAIGDAADPVGVLIDRLDPPTPATPTSGLLPRAPRSQLVDPATADDGWLAWMGTLLGALSQPGVVLTRASLAASAFDHGSAGAMATAVQATLTGAGRADGKKLVRVAPYPGVDWSILVETYAAQTPDAAATLAAARLEQPATHAVTLNVIDGISWSQLETLSNPPTWASAESSGLTWEQLGAMVPDV